MIYGAHNTSIQLGLIRSQVNGIAQSIMKTSWHGNSFHITGYVMGTWESPYLAKTVFLLRRALVMHICLGELDHHRLRQCLVTCLVSSHCQNNADESIGILATSIKNTFLIFEKCHWIRVLRNNKKAEIFPWNKFSKSMVKEGFRLQVSSLPLQPISQRFNPILSGIDCPFSQYVLSVTNTSRRPQRLHGELLASSGCIKKALWSL